MIDVVEDIYPLVKEKLIAITRRNICDSEIRVTKYCPPSEQSDWAVNFEISGSETYDKEYLQLFLTSDASTDIPIFKLEKITAPTSAGLKPNRYFIGRGTVARNKGMYTPTPNSTHNCPVPKRSNRRNIMLGKKSLILNGARLLISDKERRIVLN